MLSDQDVENAKRLYIMTNFESSVGVTSPDFKVCDIFSYSENKITVTCEYQTVFEYF
jgi:hypothetical protein